MKPWYEDGAEIVRRVEALMQSLKYPPIPRFEAWEELQQLLKEKAA